MENQNNTLVLSQEKLEMIFGKLMPYINDDDVTDINCNSRSVWLDSITKGRYEVKGLDIDSDEIERMGYLMSNENNEQFNVAYPILQAELPLPVFLPDASFLHSRRNPPECFCNASCRFLQESVFRSLHFP